jgi:hypothetical protein
MCARSYIVPIGIFILTTSTQVISQDFGEAWWAVPGPDGVQRVNILCGQDFLDPSAIVVRENVPVELAVSTMKNLPQHNFVINVPGSKAINANIPIKAEQTKFAFNPGVLGDYQVACRDNAEAPDPQLIKRKQGKLIVIR